MSELRLADPRFGEDAVEALRGVLASGHLSQGPVVEEFERGVADFCGAAHAIATTSATTAIELALAALGVDGEVLVADFTYPASGNAVVQRGGTPVLLDVDPATWCLDPDALEAALTSSTQAVIAVDVFGLPADYTRIEPLLAERGVPLICDAACSLGGAIGERRTGTFGLMSCFSFHPRKSLTTGEGGMVLTEDAELAERMRLLRNHGGRRSGWKVEFVANGFNYRMSDLQAALGVVQLPGFAATVEKRGTLAWKLTGLLAEVEGVTPQGVPAGFRHPYQSFVVELDEGLDRDDTIERLRAAGVESTLGTYALHAEPAFQGDCPRSRGAWQRTLALPLHQRLEPHDMETVADALREALSG
ncbi:MAG: DegT/DnrJ/EryC1/StrS family aminotransferase [Thermoleophilaceae bacterium]|nr:DegT/DnrJ/EryC1/StrS family aminotransferase [Thermoleophilaceae bacterium]